MVLYSIGVYIINRTLRGRLDIRNFSSRLVLKIFQHSKRNFVSPHVHVISSMYQSLSLILNSCLTKKKPQRAKNTIVTLSLSNISLAFFNVSSPRAIASCAVLLALVTFVNRPSSLLIRPGHSAIFLLTSSSFLLKLWTKASSASRIC